MQSLGPYLAYKDSGVPWLGDVPAHWELRRIKRMAMLNPSRAETRSVLTKCTPVTFLPMERVGVDGKYDTREITDASTVWNGFTYFRRGDVLVAKITPCFENGKGACLDSLPTEYGFGSTEFHVLRPGPFTSSHYLYRLTTLEEFRRLGADAMTGAAGQQRVPKSFVADFLSPLPPPSEQAAIVRYLDYVDARIRRYVRAKRRLIELLTEQAQVLTQTAANMTGTRSLRLGVVADKVTQLICRQPDQVYIPIGLYNRGRGIFHKPSTKGMDLGDSTFSWISEGDFVISGQFAWEGAIALAGPADEGCIASHRYPVLRGKPDVAESAYLLSFFKTGWGQLLLDHYSRGAAGRNRPLNIERLMKEKIPVPPLSAQKQITRLIHLESRLRQSVAQLTTILREYRTRLIADVVTGKLDVREAAARLPAAEEEQEAIEDTELEDEASVPEGSVAEDFEIIDDEVLAEDG